MNRQQFNDTLEKLRQAPRKAEVLRLVLAGHTNAEIARLRGRAEGTIRKQISQIYKDFAITSEFLGDQALRDKLKALFRNYEFEWIATCPSTVTNQVINEGEQENQSGNPPPVSSSTNVKDLMSLATRILEQVAFDQKFKVKRASQYVGYQLKNPGVGDKRYQLVLAQCKEGLCISIRQDILEPHILNLNYWVFIEEVSEVGWQTVGRFWILPSKKNIFLEQMNPIYWSRFENERVEGDVYLNSAESDGYASWVVPDSDIVARKEFSPDTLSDTDTYLILRKDKLFPDTWQAYISSSEVLEEVLGHFAKKIIESQ
jgi:hypothetical protein